MGWCGAGNDLIEYLNRNTNDTYELVQIMPMYSNIKLGYEVVFKQVKEYDEQKNCEHNWDCLGINNNAVAICYCRKCKKRYRNEKDINMLLPHPHITFKQVEKASDKYADIIQTKYNSNCEHELVDCGGEGFVMTGHMCKKCGWITSV